MWMHGFWLGLLKTSVCCHVVGACVCLKASIKYRRCIPYHQYIAEVSWSVQAASCQQNVGEHVRSGVNNRNVYYTEMLVQWAIRAWTRSPALLSWAWIVYNSATYNSCQSIWACMYCRKIRLWPHHTSPSFLVGNYKWLQNFLRTDS